MRALRRKAQEHRRRLRFEVADSKAAKTDIERDLILGFATMSADERQRFDEIVNIAAKPSKIVGIGRKHKPARQLFGSHSVAEDLGEVTFMLPSVPSHTGSGK